MPPTFESHGAGVTVKDDQGRILGQAYPYGQPLSSEAALEQVGFEPAPGTPSGVRRQGTAPAPAEVSAPTPAAGERRGPNGEWIN